MSENSGMDDDFLADAERDLSGWKDPVARLRAALDNNELSLYCQPVRTLVGVPGFPLAEVLIRLREEESAMLPPGEFLPVFEHYRMMPELDRWVVRATLQRLARGSRVPRFSINVSAQSLDDAEFPRAVADSLRSSGVSALSLLFEIDEPDALAKPDAAARFSAAMKALGVGIMIDGFGRRAASFAPVRELEPAFVKVDGSIIRRVLANDSASAKIKAIVRVSEVLRFGVIAECVEEQAILVRLQALGVGYAQGFGVYRPHPIDAIAG